MFQTFYPPIIEKKQQHLEFTLNVKLVRAFIAHVYRYHPPLPYTCQLFLRYKREIFIPGVLGILKTTRSFPKVPEKVRSLPKKSEDVRRRPRAKFSSPSRRTRINASSLPVLFTSKIRDREEGIVIYSFYTWFSFLTYFGNCVKQDGNNSHFSIRREKLARRREPA